MSDNIGPCVYPRCRDSEGNARLTRQTMCDSCRRHYALTLDRLALDYVTLWQTMPARAIIGEPIRRSNSKEYGHPREWASDMKADIADVLNSWEDDLRDHLGEEPAPHPGVSERRRVRHAHRYLTARIDALCTMPGAGDAAEEMLDVHAKARRGLGHTSPYTNLPTPCPDCGLLTLVRHIDHAADDQIECQNCPRVIKPPHYRLYARIVLDDLLGAAS